MTRYTLTYEPAADRVVPSPPCLFLRIKNTSAIPLRAAYLGGPFSIHVAAYPDVFNPNSKLQNPRRDGTPQFEPNLKAGATFTARLTVPEDLRIKSQPDANEADNGDENRTVTWIIEVTSQILFSSTASVKFELLVGRDEKSLGFNFNAVPSNRHAEPSKVLDLQADKHRRSSVSGHGRGVYSKAISLVVEDTDSLWDRPKLPVWEEPPAARRRSSETRRRKSTEATRPRNKKKQKIHLVILTHGLHSNLGADLLYLKESIDAIARRNREAARSRKSTSKNSPNAAHDMGNSETQEPPSIAPLSGGQEDLQQDDEDIDEEEVVVRGFPGNAVRTENGIQYLGKRLARFILEFTYPDQPVQFVKKRSFSQKIKKSMTFKPGEDEQQRAEGRPSHEGSKIRIKDTIMADLAYTFTSISFIGHSLGGLVQLYAIAYIQKHAPGFFEKIKPINFIAMATPFLGLSNENPSYVKFALDFGFIGKTGRDLGLAWKPSSITRSGWSAMVGGLGGGNKTENQEDPRTKPLLRVLPTGPAHIVLRKFRNRTVYSNVVNDGIVPLRTSCLLFLDWRGLGKVEKARRENGLVGTFVGWGLAEFLGQSSTPVGATEDEEDGSASESDENNAEIAQQKSTVPQPSENAVNEDDETRSVKSLKSGEESRAETRTEGSGTLDAILNFLRPSSKPTKKDRKMFSRSQTLSVDQRSESGSRTTSPEPRNNATPEDRARVVRPLASRGDSVEGDNGSSAPPRTTFFESAADLLSPPTPPTPWIIDPSTRSRTIFHDRVYHPEDIPPPPDPRARVMSSHSMKSTSTADETSSSSGSTLRVEEKIARAYHRDLSWRKVLVRLEPDAHNNMIVRRMFANAYGWPVIKHLCDTHFGDTYAALTRDEFEPSNDRAQGVSQPLPNIGEQVAGQQSKQPPSNVPDELLRKATGELKPLKEGGIAEVQARIKRDDSVEVDDSYLDDTSDEEDPSRHPSPFQKLFSGTPKSPPASPERRTPSKDKSKVLEPQLTPHTVIANTIVTEPGSIDGSKGMAPLSTGSAPSSFAGTAELGLRKSLPEVFASPTEDPSVHPGVTELVARHAAVKDGERET
jgi:putative serine esterase DUF676